MGLEHHSNSLRRPSRPALAPRPDRPRAAAGRPRVGAARGLPGCYVGAAAGHPGLPRLAGLRGLPHHHPGPCRQPVRRQPAGRRARICRSPVRRQTGRPRPPAAVRGAPASAAAGVPRRGGRRATTTAPRGPRGTTYTRNSKLLVLYKVNLHFIRTILLCHVIL